MSTRPIVDRIQAGDHAAEDELVATLRRRVFVVILARVGDAESARDLTQDALMAILQAVRDRKVAEPDRLGAFAHGVARNLANSHIRSRSLVPTLVELTDDAAWADAAEEAEMADRRRQLGAAIGTLDDIDRRILTLSVVEGCSAPEVSTRLGLTADAVRARKSRALRRLGERLRQGLSHLAVVSPLSPRGAVQDPQ